MNAKQKAAIIVKMRQVINRSHAVDSIAKSIEEITANSYGKYNSISIKDIECMVADLHTASQHLEIMVNEFDDNFDTMIVDGKLDAILLDDPIL